MRPGVAESRAGGIDEARVDRGQGLCADAVAVEGARREVLEQDVGVASQIAQQVATGIRFEVQGHGLLVAVQHHERVTHERVPGSAHAFAAGRFDLDDPCAGHGEQVAAIGSVVNLPEVEDGDAREGLAFQLHIQGLRKDER